MKINRGQKETLVILFLVLLICAIIIFQLINGVQYSEIEIDIPAHMLFPSVSGKVPLWIQSLGLFLVLVVTSAISVILNRSISNTTVITLGICSASIYLVINTQLVLKPDPLSLFFAILLVGLLYTALFKENPRLLSGLLFVISGIVIGLSALVKLPNLLFLTFLLFPIFFTIQEPDSIGVKTCRLLLISSGVIISCLLILIVLDTMKILDTYQSTVEKWFNDLSSNEAEYGWYQTRKRFMVDWGRSLYLAIAFFLGLKAAVVLTDYVPRRYLLLIFVCSLAVLAWKVSAYHILYADTILGIGLIMLVFNLISIDGEQVVKRRFLSLIGLIVIVVLSIWSDRDNKFAVSAFIMFFPIILSHFTLADLQGIVLTSKDDDRIVNQNILVSKSRLKTAELFIVFFFIVSTAILLLKEWFV